MSEELGFDRKRFADIPTRQLSAEREELLARLGEPTQSAAERETSRARIDAAVQSTRAELERRLAELAERAAAAGSLTSDDLRGLADLWLVARDRDFGEALHNVLERRHGEPARSKEDVAGEMQQLRWEIRAREAELVLRIAEKQLASAGETLDSLLAERLVRQVFTREDLDTASAAETDAGSAGSSTLRGDDLERRNRYHEPPLEAK